MDRILVVVFNDASKAFEGRDALKELHHEDEMTLYAYAIITKKPDGTCIVNEEDDRAGLKTAIGSSIGALIGLLGGPPGFAIGTVAGFLTGVTAYLNTSRVSADFVDEVSKALTPGKFALVADVDEDWTRWIDLRMEELGGAIYRYAPSDVKRAAHEDEVAAMKTHLASLKAEHAQAGADRKAKLYEKINQLDTKIQQQLEKAKKRREEEEHAAKARAEVLKTKASASKEKEAEVHV
jgi:uncharacterized membrane protein